MTAEERATACRRPTLREDGGIDWSQADECVMPDDLQERIVAAIRAAVAEEREACARALEEMRSENKSRLEQFFNDTLTDGANAIRRRGNWGSQ